MNFPCILLRLKVFRNNLLAWLSLELVVFANWMKTFVLFVDLVLSRNAILLWFGYPWFFLLFLDSAYIFDKFRLFYIRTFIHFFFFFDF